MLTEQNSVLRRIFNDKLIITRNTMRRMSKVLLCDKMDNFVNHSLMMLMMIIMIIIIIASVVPPFMQNIDNNQIAPDFLLVTGI